MSATVVRWSKITLVAAMQLYFLLVVLDNIVDFHTNYDFVQHVLSMDTVGAGSHAMGRAIHAPGVWMAFYVWIILWEALSAMLLAWGVMDLWGARQGTAAEFVSAKSIAIAGLTVGMLQWMVAFLTVGGEFFLMWQSPVWNGQQEAFRMFMVEAVVLVIVMLPENESDVSK